MSDASPALTGRYVGPISGRSLRHVQVKGRVKTAPAGRRCACGKALSIYNLGDTCAEHKPFERPRIRGRKQEARHG